ncbi:MAG: imidazolonepropionase, partial [Pyrinomonadaceae bacterium]
KRLDKMLACGTTTCEIKTGYGLETSTELKMLKVIEDLDTRHPVDIVPTFLAAHTIPSEYKNDAGGYVDLICNEMLPAAWEWYAASHFSAAGRPFFADVFCEKNAFDLDQSRQIFETAKKLGFGIKAHVDQFTNLGGSGLALEMNAVSIDHLDAISDAEITHMASRETIGVVIPTENFNAGKTQFAPARKMIDAGCSVALSTDYNPGSAPCPSLPMAMAIACRYQKLRPSEALNAATVNAAHAIDIGESVGSIEIGKNADLTIFDCDDYRELAYEFGNSRVNLIVKNGRPIHPVN